MAGVAMGRTRSRCSGGVADHGDEDKDDDEMLDRLTCFQLSFFQAQWLCSERKQLRRRRRDGG